MDSISFAEKRKNARKPHKTMASGQKKNLTIGEAVESEASGSRIGL